MRREILLKQRGLCILASLLLLPASRSLAQRGMEDVVAQFGKNKITLEEYRQAYLELLKNPRVFDSPTLRAQFLDEMIAARLIAQEAVKQGYATNELLRTKVTAYKEKCMRAEHFEAVIKPKFKVDENDVEEAYMFTQEKRKIRHLFFQQKLSADSAYQLLLQGTSFDSIARHIFIDSTLGNSGGDLGWVEWDQLDYDLAMTAFRQKPGIYSKPVKSPFGYHIIEVTDFQKQPLITRQQYVEHRRKAKYLLEYKLGDKYAQEHVDDMLARVRVQYRPDVMDFVRTKLENQFTRKPKVTDDMTELQLHDSEVKVVETSLGDARNEVMAVINGKNYTVGEFIGVLSYIPYAVVYTSFRKTFDYAVRDFLLTQEAKQMGLEKARTVKVKTILFREYQLQLAFRRDLVHRVTINDNDIKQYYDAHRDALGAATFEDVKGALSQLVLNKKKEGIVPEFVAHLTTMLTIKKNMKAINDYYDAVYNHTIQ
jgi:parvulin-like peptidyl-prolyl isomerase